MKIKYSYIFIFLIMTFIFFGLINKNLIFEEWNFFKLKYLTNSRKSAAQSILESKSVRLIPYIIILESKLENDGDKNGSGICGQLLYELVEENKEIVCEYLKQCLKHPDVEVRYQAIFLLSNIGNNARCALPEIIVTLNDGFYEIRYRAARTIGNIGKDANVAKDALKDNLDDEYLGVRQVSEWALKEIEE